MYQSPLNLGSYVDTLPTLTGCLNGRYSGFTVDGTFSQYVVSWVTHVTPIPDQLSSAEYEPPAQVRATRSASARGASAQSSKSKGTSSASATRKRGREQSAEEDEEEGDEDCATRVGRVSSTRAK